MKILFFTVSLCLLRVAAAQTQEQSPRLTPTNSSSIYGECGFGFSIAVNEEFVIASAPFDSRMGNSPGVVKVFDTKSGAMLFTIPNPISLSNEWFGCSIAISGTLLVVGSAFDDSREIMSGRAFVYDLRSVAPLVPVAVLQNSRKRSNWTFGKSVAISGSKVLVGAFWHDTGEIDEGRSYVYDLTSRSPTAPLITLKHPIPSKDAYFGYAVANSGKLMVIGAPLDDAVAADSGSAYVFDLGCATPSVPVAVLPNPNPAAFARFGYSVAISGSLVVVGAQPEEKSVIDGGNVYVYDLSGNNPTNPVTMLSNPNKSASDGFGQSVAISGTRVVVGDCKNDAGAENAGTAYVYALGSSASTSPSITLSNPTPAVNDLFGFSVAISGTRVVVGAHRDDTRSNDAGSVYVYDISGTKPNVPVVSLHNSFPP